MSAETFGITHDGCAVTRYTLGTHGPVTLRVLDLGATVQELWAPDRDGVTANVVLGGAAVADYADPRRTSSARSPAGWPTASTAPR